jgi:hypothetical protein
VYYLISITIFFSKWCIDFSAGLSSNLSCRYTYTDHSARHPCKKPGKLDRALLLLTVLCSSRFVAAVVLLMAGRMTDRIRRTGQLGSSASPTSAHPGLATLASFMRAFRLKEHIANYVHADVWSPGDSLLNKAEQDLEGKNRQSMKELWLSSWLLFFIATVGGHVVVGGCTLHCCGTQDSLPWCC